MGQKYSVIEAADDAAKLGYSVGLFGVRAFYGVSGLESLGNAMDAYSAERFRQRLEYFTNNHKILSEQVKKEFYDDIKTNKQNLNYLYEFIEKARVTTYELHARLLARLSVELIKNKGLSYFESSLLSNLNLLNDEDIKIIYAFLKEYKNSDVDARVTFQFNSYNYLNTFNKAVQIALIDELGAGMMFDSSENKREEPKQKQCYLTPFSKDLLLILDDILGDEDSNI